MQILTFMQWHWPKWTSYQECNAYYQFDRAAFVTSSHIQSLTVGDDTYKSCDAKAWLKMMYVSDIIKYDTELRCDPLK